MMVNFRDKQPSGCFLKSPLLFYLLVMIALPSTVSASQDIEWKTSLESLNISEPVSIKANFDKWLTSDFQSGEKIYTKQNAFSGVRWNDTEIGFNYRYHYHLNFSKDTALWHYYESNDLNDKITELKRPLEIDLKANQVRASGFYIKQDFNWNHFKLYLRANYVSMEELTQGIAVGQYDSRRDLNNQTQIVIDYAYSEEPILDRTVDRPEGNGWIVDLGLSWDFRKHHMVAKVDEAYSSLSWNKAPASKIQGNLVDLDIRQDAALQFEEFYSKLEQTLPTHYKLSYHYDAFSFASVGLSVEKIDKQQWNRLSILGATWYGIDSALSWSPEEDLVGIKLTHQYVSLSIETDQLDLEQSRVLNFSLGFNVSF